MTDVAGGLYASINGIGQISVVISTQPDVRVDLTAGATAPIVGPSAHVGTEFSINNGISGKGFFHTIASAGAGGTTPNGIDISYEHEIGTGNTSSVTVGPGIHGIASVGGIGTYTPDTTIDFPNGGYSGIPTYNHPGPIVRPGTSNAIGSLDPGSFPDPNTQRYTQGGSVSV